MNGLAYGFRPDYPLTEQLEALKAQVAEWKAQVERMARPTFAQRRKAAEDAAAALRKARLAVQELQRCGGGYLVAELDTEALRTAEQRARKAAAEVADIPMRGERDDLVTRWAVAWLLRIYRDGTGKEDIGGGFADFAEEAAANHLDVEISRRAIIQLGAEIRRS